MYFTVKAFNGIKRRFENLDNINELNEFVAEYTEKGFSKFIVKSFDSNGYRKTRFLVIENGINKFLN
jgi:uncharacterized protein YutD